MKYLAPLFLFLSLTTGAVAQQEEKWKGIDEAVIEKYAQDRGREAAEPFLNVEGDLLLFLFALGGAIGGFIMGYFWHKVFVAERHQPGKRE